jgi:hypothetical protein
VPGLAWLAMVNSQIVTTKAVITTATSAASIHRQAGMGSHVGLAPSCARRPLGSFMGASSRGNNAIAELADQSAMPGLVVAYPGRGTFVAGLG